MPTLLTKYPPEPKIIFCVVLLSLITISTVFSFFYSTPRITLDEESITLKTLFKRKTYLWKEITNVSLTTRAWYSAFPLSQRMEAMKLVSDSGESLFFWGDVYQNTDKLKKFVVQKLNDKLQFVSRREEGIGRPVFLEKKYTGNPFISFNTILVAGMFVFFVVLENIKTPVKMPILFPVNIIFFLYLIFGFQMYHFEIKDDSLFIRNHFFPWVKKRYALNDIEEVNKETPYRTSAGLQILTYQFKSKFYGAGSLRERHWKELLSDLASFGIKVPDKNF